MDNKLKRIMVFITGKESKLFYKKDNQDIHSEIIQSPITHKDDKIPGEVKDTFKVSPTHYSNNEHRKHNQYINEENQYLKEIEKKVEAYDVIYIIGPGTLKNKLHNLLSENKKYTEKSVFIEPSDNHLTDNQLLAKARSVLY